MGCLFIGRLSICSELLWQLLGLQNESITVGLSTRLLIVTRNNTQLAQLHIAIGGVCYAKSGARIHDHPQGSTSEIDEYGQAGPFRVGRPMRHFCPWLSILLGTEEGVWLSMWSESNH